MPVFFFIDPDIMDDRRMDQVDEITLTYLFGPTQSEVTYSVSYMVRGKIPFLVDPR